MEARSVASCCILGAVSLATRPIHERDREDAQRYLQYLLLSTLHPGWRYINARTILIEWNDKEARTAEEVIGLVDDTIAWLKKDVRP